MEPVLERLREDLADRRRAGVAFDAAWRPAVDAALGPAHGLNKQDRREHGAWLSALLATRSSWEAAYTLERPATRGERAAFTLTVDPDREPIALAA